MKKGILLLLFLMISNLNAKGLSPQADITVCFKALFPSDQKIYVADKFYEKPGSDHVSVLDTMVPISNYVDWMPGLSFTGKFGKLSFLNLGLKVDFEYFNVRYSEIFYNEYEEEQVYIPVTINIFNIQGGLFSSIKLSEKVVVEPEINLLFVRNYFSHKFEDNTDFVYAINKLGICSALNCSYLFSGDVEINSGLKFLSYSEFQDFLINASVTMKIFKFVKGNIGVEYSPITHSIKSVTGARIFFPVYQKR